jgi:glycosyltransferase involved in cell wall biosynthesis
MSRKPARPDISIVVPMYNEEDNIRLLHEAVAAALQDTGIVYELVIVDDGSKDRTFDLAREIANEDPRVCAVGLRRNYGQTAAMVAGIQNARGRTIITMDGDLQNDPTDIPRLLAMIDQGFDIVTGWRKKRQDGGARVALSKVANSIMARIMGAQVRDSGCSLKAYRAELIQHLPLYGEMHRFIPALSQLAGAKLAQIEVKHHPRRFGVSKYGFSRVYKVMLDIISIRVLLSFARRPMLWSWTFTVLTLAGLLPLVLIVSFSGDLPMVPVTICLLLVASSLFLLAWSLVGQIFALTERGAVRFAEIGATLASRLSPPSVESLP